MGSSTQATLLSLAREELEQRVVELGGKPFHGKIARENVLGKGQLEFAFDRVHRRSHVELWIEPRADPRPRVAGRPRRARHGAERQ